MNSVVRFVIKGVSTTLLLRCTMILALMLCCTLRVAAQIQVEYFWDEDNGIGKCTRVGASATESGEISFELSTDELSSGIHTLGLRSFIVSDTASYYSPTLYKYVLIESVKEDYAQFVEYFWDNDPGYGNGVCVALQPNATGNDVSFEVPTTGLNDGIHTLFVRTKARGWSPLTRYLVRIEREEAQFIDEIEYFWDSDPGYGNGIKIPFEQGSAVDIKEFEPDIEGMTGDHTFCVRAHSSGGWSVIYSGAISFSAEGRFTLNEQLAEGTERNFRSMNEMFDYFVARTVTADVEIALRDAATFTYNATTADELAPLSSVTEFLEQCDGRLTFSATSQGNINIITNDECIKEVMRFASFVDCENVVFKVNDDAYDFSILAYDTDEVCPGNTTETREWSSISSALTVEWSAAPHSSCKVTNYTAQGTGDLPAMAVGNSGAATDYLDYNVSFKKDGEEVLAYVYRIIVEPTVAGKSISFIYPTPDDGVMANPGDVKLYWKGVGGANSYLVAVETTDEVNGSVERDTVVLSTTNDTYNSYYNYTIAVKTGYRYKYSIRGCCKCDSTEFFSRELLSFRTNEEDIAALKVMYDKLNGGSWSKKWLFDAEVLASTNYPGVTFNNEGRVTAINLYNSNIAGELPAEGFVLPELTSLNMERNNIAGDVSAFVDECGSLKELNMRYNRLNVLEEVLPSNITTLNLEGQYYYLRDYIDELEVNEIFMDKNNMEGIVANSIAWYNHGESDFSSHPTFRIYDKNDTELKSSIGRISYSNGYYKLTSLTGDYTLAQDAEALLILSDGIATSSIYPALLSFMPGDANIDAIVDILDVQHTLNYVVGVDGASGLFNHSAANTFDDALLNVQDIVTIVNMMLDENNVAAMQWRRAAAHSQEIVQAAAYVSVNDGAVKVTATKEVAALDIVIEGVQASQLKQLLGKKEYNVIMRDTDEGVRVVVFSLTGAVIPVGVTDILSVDGDGSIVAVKAADKKAQALSVTIKDWGTTRVESIEDINNTDIVIYDLTGRRINEINSTGVYIINGEKVLVK